MPDAPNTQPQGNLIAKLLTSAALVLASGAYVFLQPATQAPAAANRAATPRVVARAEPSAPTLAPATPSAAQAPEPAPAEDRAPEKTALANAPNQEPAETPPPAVAPSEAPPAAPEAPEASAQSLASIPVPPPRGGLADGAYTGEPADCQWGTVQVALTVQSGAIAQVNFLQVPDHRRRSAEISDWTMPILAREAILAQNNNVDLVSGATATSYAFQQAFASALSKAKK